MDKKTRNYVIIGAIIILIISIAGGFVNLPFSAAGTCGTLTSLSSQMQYSQSSSLLDTITSALNPSAISLGVFKGTIQFTGACENINAARLSSQDKQANVSSFNMYLQKLSCDYTLVPDPSTSQGFGRVQTLTNTSVTFQSRLGQGSCSIDLLALDPVQYYANSPLTFSPGSVIPVSCENYFIQQCEFNQGYTAYFDATHRSGVSGTSLVSQEPALCARVQSSGTGQFLSTQGAAFKPNARVLINYNNQQITLDTSNGVTGSATSDRNAYFMLNRNTGSFNQNCPNNIILYYHDSVSKNMVSPEYLTTIKNYFNGIAFVQGQRNLLAIQNAVVTYNNALSSPVVVDSLNTNNGSDTYTVTGSGQQLSIDRLNNPNVNPAVDFIVVASQVSVAAQVANPVFIATTPSAGQCLQTTSVQPTSVSAILSSSTPGNVLVNVNCNTPLGLRTSSQQLTFNGGDTRTANFAITVPANNYSCNFVASNQAIGSWNQVAQSTSFCVQSTQAVFEDCSVVALGTLKTNDQTTGRCVCQLSQTQGQNVCGAAGQTYNANTCACNPTTPTTNACMNQPLTCPNNQTLSRNSQGCNICINNNQTNSPPQVCQFYQRPVSSQTQVYPFDFFGFHPTIGSFNMPTTVTTNTCDTDWGVVIIGGIAIISVAWSFTSMGGRSKRR